MSKISLSNISNTINRLTDKVIMTIKRIAAKRSVRSICALLLVAQCVLLTLLTLANRFNPVYTGLLVLSICVIIDMIPDAFIDNDGGNDETEKGPDSK